jgi:hypothetical protein
MRRYSVTAGFTLLSCALLLAGLGSACGPGSSAPGDSAGPGDGAGSDARWDGSVDQGHDDAAQSDAAADAATQQDVAPQQDAQSDTIPAFGCYGFLINEFQTQGTSESDEFVEIAGPVGGDLSPLKLVYRGATESIDTVLFAFSTGNTIPASGFVVIASDGWVGGDAGVPAYGSYLGGATGKLTLSGGGLALRSGVPNTGTIVDSVGYGTASNTFVQGTPTGAHPAGKSSSRSPRCKSTGNNAADFSLTNPTPGK